MVLTVCQTQFSNNLLMSIQPVSKLSKREWRYFLQAEKLLYASGDASVSFPTGFYVISGVLKHG